MLYNPVNMKIEDEKRLYEKDKWEHNKKRRYGVRYDIEHDVHVMSSINVKARGISESIYWDSASLNKITHHRFMEHLERGFDILTNDPLEGPRATKKLYEPLVKPKP